MANGDITGPNIDQKEDGFGAVTVTMTRQARLSDTIFCQIYNNDTGSGVGTNWASFATLSIDSSGIITYIDSIVYNASISPNSLNSHFVTRISDTVAGIVWANDDLVAGSELDGSCSVTTVGVAADGTITGVIDEFEFEPVSGDGPSMCRVSGDVYAIIYSNDAGEVGGHKVVTLSISTAGAITPAVIDSGVFDDGQNPGLQQTRAAIAKIPGTTKYVLAYQGLAVANKWLRTIDITDSGVVTISGHASLEYTTAGGSGVLSPPNMVFLANTVWAVSYRDSGSDGHIASFLIASDGSTITAVSDFEYVLTVVTDNDVVVVNSTVGIIAVAYEGAGNIGIIETFDIDPTTGVITGTIDTYTFDSSLARGVTPFIVVDGICAVLYNSITGVSLQASTFAIEGAEAPVEEEEVSAPSADVGTGGFLEIDNYVPRFGGDSIDLVFPIKIQRWQETIETGAMTLPTAGFRVDTLALNIIKMVIDISGVVYGTHTPHPLTSGESHAPDLVDLEEAAILWNKDAPQTRARLKLPLVSGVRSYEGVISRMSLIDSPGHTAQEFKFTFTVAWTPVAPELREWN
jgi:hypothetical protein